MEGEWSGTLLSAGLSSRRIEVRLIQEADEIEGSWNTVDSGPRWVGAIGAFVSPGSLKGDMWVEFPSGDNRCQGVGTLAGDVNSSAATLRWLGVRYSASACGAADVPNALTLQLQR
jgi:hypothetical protein